tara:strand:+ start:1710 stop:2666 length:957 start_codon:yes stop_codon:yes gene_type:complete
MNILFIGFSSLVKRRVLSSVAIINGIKKISIASQSLNNLDMIENKKRGELFSSYNDAIHNSKCELVYISLPNSLHYKYAKKSLESGKHVIIDKPSVMNENEAKDLYDLSNEKNLCLAEANVWMHHNIAKSMKSFFKKNCKPLNINMTFTSPPLDEKNFRYNPKYGSGIIYDRASYVISCGKYFYDSYPEDVKCFVNKIDQKNGVDISASLALVYSEGQTIQSFISLSAEYKNEISCIGKNYSIFSERIFTPPSDYEANILVSESNEKKIINVAKDNSFKNFIVNVIESIWQNKYSDYAFDLLNQSKIMDKIIEKGKGL